MVEVAVDRIVDPLDRAAQLPVGILGNFFRVPDRLVVDAGLVEERCHVFLVLVLRPGLDGIVDGALILGLDAVVVARSFAPITPHSFLKSSSVWAVTRMYPTSASCGFLEPG